MNEPISFIFHEEPNGHCFVSTQDVIPRPGAKTAPITRQQLAGHRPSDLTIVDGEVRLRNDMVFYAVLPDPKPYDKTLVILGAVAAACGALAGLLYYFV